MPDEVLAPAGVALWLWMAWAHSRGHYWARVVFTVAFGLSSLSLLFALAGGAAVLAPADLAAGAAVWMVEAAAMLLIFNKRSAAYFPPKKAQPGAIRA